MTKKHEIMLYSMEIKILKIFENHSNYNCQITLDNGDEYKVYANWIHNESLDFWQGWTCYAGSTRLSIDQDFNVWSGECRNDYLGSALHGFNLVDHTVCKRNTCTGCTDDLLVKKYAQVIV